jgi:membrane protein DedA with SNARE-associated domain
MTSLVHYVLLYGIPLIFINVLLEQIGMPVPAAPTLIVAGALSRDGKMSSTHVLLAALLASLIADYIWFLLGQRYGYRILRVLCRISLSPDSCVRDTEARFERWGLKSPDCEVHPRILDGRASAGRRGRAQHVCVSRL